VDPRLVVVVGYPDAELLDIACVTTSLALANDFGGVQPPYRVLVATPGGRPIACVPSLTLQSHQALERITGPVDTLVISGGRGCEAVADTPELVARIRRIARHSRRVASVCTGATILAATGLLDGRRATTHWGYAQRLAARHPAVTVDPGPIYIREGNVLTAAGVTSALDLALAFIDEDHGPDTARQVARELVTYLQRPANQAQISIFLTDPPPAHRLVRGLVDHITSHLDTDLTTSTLAAVAGLSERHLTRLFAEHLGQTPGRYVRQARTEAAAQLLATSTLSVARVAKRCGFGSPETLRQAFVAHYGTTPSRYRMTQPRPYPHETPGSSSAGAALSNG
jgi:transcriptional regulator GlxA family with amidase domain